MEVYDSLINEIEGYSYQVHHKDEVSFSYLGEEDTCIEVINPDGDEEDNLYIDFNEYKAVLSFANNQEEYQLGYEEDLYFLLRDIKDILEDKKCSLSLYYHADAFMKCLAGGFLKAKDAEGKEVKEIFRFVYLNEELKTKIETNGGRLDIRYWDTSLNSSLEVGKKKKS